MKPNPIAAAVLLALPLVTRADGDVIIDLAANSDDTSGFLATAADGRIYVNASANPNTPVRALFAFDANGSAVSTFGTNGRIAVEDAGPIAVRPDGSLLTGRYIIVGISPTGAQLSSVAACGAPTLADCPMFNAHFNNVYLPLPDGRTWSAGGNATGGFGSSSWVLRRITTTGVLDTTFANGVGWVNKDGGQSLQISRIRLLANGQIAVMGTDFLNVGPISIGRFNADGSTDFSFGTNGLVALASPGSGWTPGTFAMNSPLGVDAQQRYLVPGGNNVVARYNTDGTPDGTYTAVAKSASISYTDFVVDSQGRVVIFGVSNQQLYFARLLANGGLDPSFGTGGETLAMPAAAGATQPLVSSGAVDASDRPVVLFNFLGASGSRDVGVMRLTAGGVVDGAFGAAWTDADPYPDAFSIAANTAPFGTTYVASTPVTPSGFNTRTSITLQTTTTNSGYSVGCTGTYVTTPGTIDPGQSLCVRHSASGTAGGTSTTVVAVGGRQSSYQTTATTTPADTAPDAFAFTDQTNAARSTSTTSNAVAIAGIAGNAAISVDFGQYSINCDPSAFRSTSSTIANGQTVCVRVTSSANFSTAVSATLAIGGVTDTFSVTTLAEDITPDAFAFTAQTGVANSTAVTSNAVTIAGINSAAAISVAGGEYSIGCNGTFASANATITSGQTVCVRHTSSSQASATTTTTLTVGGVSSAFTSTTSAPPPSSGGGGGAMSWLELTWLALLLSGGRFASLRLGRTRAARAG